MVVYYNLINSSIIMFRVSVEWSLPDKWNINDKYYIIKYFFYL